MRDRLAGCAGVLLILAMFTVPFLLSLSATGQLVLVVGGVVLTIGIVVWGFTDLF